LLINLEKVKNETQYFFNSLQENLNSLCSNMSYEFYMEAVDLILQAEAAGKRVHMTGIGKPGHVAGYFASLMSSTGTPTYFLDGTEAVHGSSGQVCPGDIVIAISNSGETTELICTVEVLKRNNAKIIGVSGRKDSWLAKRSEVFLHAPVINEGGPLNRAPRNSILSELCILQGLSVVLQSIKNITPQQYVAWHPGGALGKLRKEEIR
jgi:D-arabinose 5-phosphate isomerase GutQ